jgi:hypothetical protein
MKSDFTYSFVFYNHLTKTSLNTSGKWIYVAFMSDMESVKVLGVKNL